MAQTTASLQKQFRGVSCSRCRLPIPVSTMIVSTMIGSLEGELHAFALRCRACEEEGVYTIADIQSFRGEPTNRRFRLSDDIRSRAAISWGRKDLIAPITMSTR